MEKKRKILENPVVVGILELVIFFVGAILAQIIISLFTDVIFKSLEEGSFKEFINTFIELVSFIMTIIICMLFMKLTMPKSLKIFTQGKVSDRLRAAGIGLIIGLGANFIISLIAALTGSVEVSFNGFSPYILLVIPGVFIQCSTEEVLCRGFVASFLKERGHIAIIVVGGLCFILHHVGNLFMFGMSITF